jgi:hypothetical protein
MTHQGGGCGQGDHTAVREISQEGMSVEALTNRVAYSCDRPMIKVVIPEHKIDGSIQGLPHRAKMAEQ